MICPKCGKEMPDDTEICAHCETTAFDDDAKNEETVFDSLLNKTKDVAKFVGDKAEDAVAVTYGKTKVFVSAAGEKTKDFFQDAEKKISATYADTKEKIELMKREKKIAEEDRTVQDKVKDEVKIDQALKDALDQYNQEYTMLSNYGMDLYIQRERAADLILNVEDLINSIANCPKSFDADVREVKTHCLEFKDAGDYAAEELDAAKKAALGAGSGAAAGVMVASLAPTTAMWIATTFGTASTGTAISELSGAVATQAALAWLGGGTVAAGGGGVAAGNAFLAMCGPVGWSIAGATLLTSVVLFAANKVKLQKQKKAEVESVMRNTSALKETNAKVGVILEETNALRDSLAKMYRENVSLYKQNFASLSDEEKIRLGTLVNNAKSLSKTLNKTV